MKGILGQKVLLPAQENVTGLASSLRERESHHDPGEPDNTKWISKLWSGEAKMENE